MAIKAQVIVDDARNTLQDEGATKRWSDADLTLYLNSAVLQTALVRPDATAKVSSVQLAAGTKQALPSDGLRLLDVVRNMGVNGSTPGNAVLRADRANLDAFSRGWHGATAAGVIKNFAFDDRTPKAYYVTPPVTGTVYAEIVYSAVPARVDSTLLATTDIPIDDVYYGALKDWMLREAYQIDVSAISEQRARLYEASFYQRLGLKYQTDRALSPHAQPAPGAQMVPQ